MNECEIFVDVIIVNFFISCNSAHQKECHGSDFVRKNMLRKRKY